MYIPLSFKVEDSNKLAAIIQQYSFATVITHDGTSPFVSHLPVLFHPLRGIHGTLVSHMARANPQWQHFANGEEVLTVFHGPHSYISPSWYETELAVPTWNYVVVHTYGLPRLIENAIELQNLLQETVDTYEASFSNAWKGDLPEDFRANLIKAIVGFEIPISRIEGKFKLGQNRTSEDLHGVFQALSNSPSENDQILAEIMTRECNWK